MSEHQTDDSCLPEDCDCLKFVGRKCHSLVVISFAYECRNKYVSCT